MEVLSIVAVLIGAVILIIILEIIRESLLELHSNCLNEGHPTNSQSTPKRTIPELIALVDLSNDEKFSKHSVYIKTLNEDHFLFYLFVSLSHQTSRPGSDYPQQLRHCVFSLLHFLSLLVLSTMFTLFVFPRNSTCSTHESHSDCSISRSQDGWTVTSLHNRFCEWDSDRGVCYFRPNLTQYHDSTPLLLFHLIIITAVCSILHFIFSFLSNQIVRLFKHYLFIKCCQYQQGPVHNKGSYGSLRKASEYSKVNPVKVQTGGDSLVRLEAGKRLQDDNDELICLQPSSSLLFRGIRLSILQRRIDFVRPLQEWEFLLNKSKAPNHFLRWEQRPSSFVSKNWNCFNYLNLQFQLLQFRLYSVAGNPVEARSFLNHCQQHHDSLILRKLLQVRERTTTLSNQLRRLPFSEPLDYREVDLRLLQYFLIYWFNGLTREVLQLKYHQQNVKRENFRFLAQLFPRRIDSCALQPSIIRREALVAPLTSFDLRYNNRTKSVLLLTAALVVALFAASLVFLIYFLPNNVINPDNRPLLSWIWAIVIAYEAIYQSWIVPLRSLFYSLFLPKFIDDSYTILLQLLPSKVRNLLRKDSSYLSNIFSAIQFFHPAVRLARAFPASAIARVLITMNDYDLPVSELQQKRRDSHPMYELWRLDYSNLHQDIWSDDNPLLAHRLQLLWENWKIRGFYCLSLLYNLFRQTWRGILHLLLLLPLPVQRMVMEVYLGWFCFGSALLLCYSLEHSSPLFAAVLVFVCSSLFLFFDVCIGWTSRLWSRYFEGLQRRNQVILKYRKRLRRKLTIRKPLEECQSHL